MNFKRHAKYAMIPMAAVVAALAMTACALGGDDVYEGERIEVINPFTPSGSTGNWLALVTPFLAKHVPGEPTVQAISRAGAGGSIGANFFHNNTASDGTFLLASSGSNVFPFLFNQEGVTYDYADYTAILASPLGGIFYVAPSTGITNVAGLCNASGLRYLTVRPDGLDVVVVVGLELLEDLNVQFNDPSADVNVSQGADSRGNARASFQNGEVNVSYDSLKSELDPLFEANLAVPIFSVGILDADGELARDPTYPDLPHYGEVYQECNGRPLDGVEADVYRAIVVAGFALQKTLWVKSDVDQAQIDALIEGAEALVEDPEFQSMKDALVGQYEFAVGEQAQEQFSAAAQLSDEAFVWLRDLLNSKYEANIPDR